MSSGPAIVPTATVRITQPASSTMLSVPVGTLLSVAGAMSWSPPLPGFVASLRLEIVRAADGHLITPGGLAPKGDITDSGFSWSRTFAADAVVDGGQLRAVALGQDRRELAEAILPITVTEPVVVVAVDQPPADSPHGVNEAIAVAGTVTWTPAQPGYVRSLRVALLRRSSGSVLDLEAPALIEVGAGVRRWACALGVDHPEPEALIRATALDRHDNPLATTELAIAIPRPDVTLTITSPAASPVPAFPINEPIRVAANLTWTPAGPDYIQRVLISLVRSDGVEVVSREAEITPDAPGRAAARGTVEASAHLITAKILVLAFDRFSNEVGRKDVAIRIP